MSGAEPQSIYNYKYDTDGFVILQPPGTFTVEVGGRDLCGECSNKFCHLPGDQYLCVKIHSFKYTESLKKIRGPEWTPLKEYNRQVNHINEHIITSHECKRTHQTKRPAETGGI